MITYGLCQSPPALLLFSVVLAYDGSELKSLGFVLSTLGGGFLGSETELLPQFIPRSRLAKFFTSHRRPFPATN
ncbi:hypothetical protein JOM56_012827 [Amanita muscaria]